MAHGIWTSLPYSIHQPKSKAMMFFVDNVGSLLHQEMGTIGGEMLLPPDCSWMPEHR